MDEQLSILVVDDDEGIRDLVGEHLEEMGLEVILAENGAEALAVLAKRETDLVITDYKMPMMNGLQLCQAIRDKNIKSMIIMMTAYGDYELTKSAISTGIFDFIEKPFGKEVLVHRVSRAVDQVRIKNKEVAILNKLFKMLRFKSAIKFDNLDTFDRLSYLDKMTAVVDLKFTRMEKKDSIKLN